MNPARRQLLRAIGATVVVATGVRAADERQRRVVWIFNAKHEESTRLVRESLPARGLVEGRNLVLELEYSDGKGRTPAAIVASRPDAIVVRGSPHELQALTREIPVVFYDLAADPVKMGFVETLRRPGGNITGAALEWDLILSKMWQLLKDFRPSMKRGGVLIAKEDLEPLAGSPDWNELTRPVLRHVTERLGIEIRQIAVPRDASATSIAAAVKAAEAEALMVDLPPTPGLIDFVSAATIPTIGYPFRKARQGAVLVAVSFEYDEGVVQAAAAVARILRGESPATIPVYLQRAYGIAVNLRLARKVGINVPDSVLIQATEKIE